MTTDYNSPTTLMNLVRGHAADAPEGVDATMLAEHIMDQHEDIPEALRADIERMAGKALPLYFEGALRSPVATAMLIEQNRLEGTLDLARTRIEGMQRDLERILENMTHGRIASAEDQMADVAKYAQRIARELTEAKGHDGTIRALRSLEG